MLRWYNIMLVGTKVHMTLQYSIVLTWMHGIRELVMCKIMELNKVSVPIVTFKLTPTVGINNTLITMGVDEVLYV